MAFRIVVTLALLALALPLGRAQAAVLGAEEPLTADLVQELLEDALPAAGAQAPFELVVDEPRLPLLNQSARATEIAVRHPHHEAASGRFNALLVGTVGDTLRFRLPVRGRVQPMRDVPVLTRVLVRGARIAAADLEMEPMRTGRLRPSSITDPDRLIGSEARRRPAPGRILTTRDVHAPRLVRRGEAVRLIYARPGLRLSALGTAQEDGALGTLVSGVENQLDTFFSGEVDNENLVDLDSNTNNTGRGNVERNEDINLNVAAVVVQVLPNGNLVIQGRQEVRVNFEVRELYVAGVARPEDIKPDNTIPHHEIAELRLAYGGRGQITDAQQPRYGAQVLDIVLPF